LRNAIVLIVVLVVVFFMLVAGRRFRHGADSPALAGDARGAVAPDFTLKTLDGKNVKLSDLRGKAVLLNFWATWCGPCKIEIPWFMELEKQYASKGLVVVGVAMDDNAKDVVPKFAQDMKIDYPVLIGTEQVADQYGGVEGLPTTFYIGRDGKIVKKIAGLTSHSDIEDNIKAALNTPNGSQAPTAMLVPQVAQ
jgi:thiol-disulfide isomerase/thioredoxin